jgi:hypothetical protein
MLLKYSKIARYDGIENEQIYNIEQQTNYTEAVKHLENLKKYLLSQGLPLNNPIQ